MTIKELFNKYRLEAEKNVRNNKLNTIVYMSGSKIRKTKLQKMPDNYKDTSCLDCELGVIDKSIHDFEMKAAGILEKSLEYYEIY